ncbi:28S ribosomal protein S11, mitochondrial [Toxocara canis]|uniref:28S ribosomal protein S11, mitochondrial n=1 Tax=Toxocara canis TaxID=6265 RepID=A0A0B2VHD6_TOXCA|nr:28S ribosomal protein S11, mitochondrial [Toxocara canis]
MALPLVSLAFVAEMRGKFRDGREHFLMDVVISFIEGTKERAEGERCSGGLADRMALRKLFGPLSRMCISETLIVPRRTNLFHQRGLRTCTKLHDSIRDTQRLGVKITRSEQPILEGTVGEIGTLISVDTSNVDRRLPTAETMKHLYNGVAFDELPIVYIKASKNNTLVTVTDHKYNIITYTSCRLEGFKNARKKTTIAGQTTGVAAGQRLVRRGIRTVRVVVKGLGPGRMTCVKGMTVAGVQVVSITDNTPLPELGPRPRKIRRV